MIRAFAAKQSVSRSSVVGDTATHNVCQTPFLSNLLIEVEFAFEDLFNLGRKKVVM